MKRQRVFLRLAIILVICAMMVQETEARRKILKGRKTITRTYYKEPAVPAWAVILIIAVFQLIAGGLAYLIMKRCIVDYRPLGKSLNSY